MIVMSGKISIQESGGIVMDRDKGKIKEDREGSDSKKGRR
jgi:hypothetical protein